MSGKIIVLTVFGGVTLLVALGVLLASWGGDASECAAKIKFSSFKKFYAINPDRWKLFAGRVACKRNSIYGFEYDNDSYLSFGFFDWIRYKHFVKTITRRKTKQSENEAIAKMLACVKQDIEAMDNKAAQYTQQAKRNIECGLVFETDNEKIERFQREINELRVE